MCVKDEFSFEMVKINRRWIHFWRSFAHLSIQDGIVPPSFVVRPLIKWIMSSGLKILQSLDLEYSNSCVQLCRFLADSISVHEDFQCFF